MEQGHDWTFKIGGTDENGNVIWLAANLRCATIRDAAIAAAAYMVKHAATGHMVVVSLEPAPEPEPEPLRNILDASSDLTLTKEKPNG